MPTVECNDCGQEYDWNYPSIICPNCGGTYIKVDPSKMPKFVSRTCDEWEEEMKDMPCYVPAVPMFDFCMNMDLEVKRYDCDKCVVEHGLRDCIE